VCASVPPLSMAISVTPGGRWRLTGGIIVHEVTVALNPGFIHATSSGEAPLLRGRRLILAADEPTPEGCRKTRTRMATGKEMTSNFYDKHLSQAARAGCVGLSRAPIFLDSSQQTLRSSPWWG
jgi:hypothetical protein